MYVYIHIYIYKDPDRGESHWQELHPQLFVRPWWRARSMLGVTSRPINAGRKKKVPSQFALHPPLCFGKAAELQPLRAWTIQHLVYYRAYDMYPYMYNMYTYVIIIWHLFQRKFSRSWMTYLLTSSFVLLELHSCNDLKWRVTWQTEYWAKGAWMKAKSIEEEKPESDWNLKRTEGARKKTGEQVTVVGKLEWNLVLCGSLSVDLSFLRGLVLHGSKSVSCSHFQHTVEIVDLPYITFFPRLGHARILAGATERTLWFQHSSPSWAVPFNGNLVRELSVCEWTVTVVYAKIDERHRTSLKYRNVQSPGHVWSVGQLFQKGFKSSCDNLRQALRELQSMCYTLRCPQSALGIMMYNGHTALKVSRELPDRRVRLKFFFQEYTDQLGCTRPVRAVRKLSAKPCSFVGKNWSEQHFSLVSISKGCQACCSRELGTNHFHIIIFYQKRTTDDACSMLGLSSAPSFRHGANNISPTANVTLYTDLT